MIIDCHMHLGDILHPNGGTIISSSISMARKLNVQWFEESVLHFNSYWWSNILFRLLDDNYTKSVQERIKCGTYKNFINYKELLKNKSNSLYSDNRVYFACMPVLPYVSFEDIIECSKADQTILPFTSINPFSSIQESCESISSQMKEAYGLKLHPIIQGIPFNSKRTFEALEAMKPFKKPVLLHSGSSRYYIGEEKALQHLEYDDVKAARNMVEAFPTINFILGHAGCAEYEEWAKELSFFENVFVDITVQSKSTIRKLINLYGEDRILFASDWPCINPEITFSTVVKAVSGQQLDKCLYKNASFLFELR